MTGSPHAGNSKPIVLILVGKSSEIPPGQEYQAKLRVSWFCSSYHSLGRRLLGVSGVSMTASNRTESQGGRVNKISAFPVPKWIISLSSSCSSVLSTIVLTPDLLHRLRRGHRFHCLVKPRFKECDIVVVLNRDTDIDYATNRSMKSNMVSDVLLQQHSLCPSSRP